VEVPNATGGIQFTHGFIDGALGVENIAAHTVLQAAPPVLTPIVFDDGDTFGPSVGHGGPGGTFDFLRVAVHEIGHALGLDHANGQTKGLTTPAAMDNATASEKYGGPGDAFLYPDDIKGIRSLYGAGVGSVTPLDPAPVQATKGTFGDHVEVTWSPVPVVPVAPGNYVVFRTGSDGSSRGENAAYRLDPDGLVHFTDSAGLQRGVTYSYNVRYFAAPGVGRNVPGGDTDAGYVAQPSTVPEIVGHVFNDVDGNGVLGSGEPGLRGWVLYLDLNSNGRRDRHDVSTTTDVNGDWRFGGVAAGTYRIGIVRKQRWGQTYPTKSIVVTVDGVGPADGNRFGVRRHHQR